MIGVWLAMIIVGGMLVIATLTLALARNETEYMLGYIMGWVIILGALTWWGTATGWK